MSDVGVYAFFRFGSAFYHCISNHIYYRLSKMATILTVLFLIALCVTVSIIRAQEIDSDYEDF